MRLVLQGSQFRPGAGSVYFTHPIVPSYSSIYNQIQLPLKPKGSLSILMTHESPHALGSRQGLEECALRLLDTRTCWVWSLFRREVNLRKIWSFNFWGFSFQLSEFLVPTALSWKSHGQAFPRGFWSPVRLGSRTRDLACLWIRQHQGTCCIDTWEREDSESQESVQMQKGIDRIFFQTPKTFLWSLIWFLFNFFVSF